MIGRLLMGTCAQTALRMSEQAEGELHGTRRWRMARHLAACDRCRAMYRALVATIAGLRLLRESEPETRPGFVADVVARIRTESGGGRPP
jgi:anti-sigma factor RsiW